MLSFLMGLGDCQVELASGAVSPVLMRYSRMCLSAAWAQVLLSGWSQFTSATEVMLLSSPTCRDTEVARVSLRQAGDGSWVWVGAGRRGEVATTLTVRDLSESCDKSHCLDSLHSPSGMLDCHTSAVADAFYSRHAVLGIGSCLPVPTHLFVFVNRWSPPACTHEGWLTTSLLERETMPRPLLLPALASGETSCSSFRRAFTSPRLRGGAECSASMDLKGSTIASERVNWMDSPKAIQDWRLTTQDARSHRDGESLYSPPRPARRGVKDHAQWNVTPPVRRDGKLVSTRVAATIGVRRRIVFDSADVSQTDTPESPAPRSDLTNMVNVHRDSVPIDVYHDRKGGVGVGVVSNTLEHVRQTL